MTTDDTCVVLFPNSSHAMRAEWVLVNAEVACTLIPTPREFSSDCGVALRLAEAERIRAVELLESALVKVEAVHVRVA